MTDVEFSNVLINLQMNLVELQSINMKLIKEEQDLAICYQGLAKADATSIINAVKEKIDSLVLEEITIQKHVENVVKGWR